jgi:hypothetical protein
MAEKDHEFAPYEESPQGIREAETQVGFTGILRAYLEWIESMLMDGSLRVSPAEEHEWRSGRYHRLELVTGGFSTDETLLGRVRQGRIAMHWESEHAGGLYVYLIPEWALASIESSAWMRPDDGIFTEVYFGDEVVLQIRRGNHPRSPSIPGRRRPCSRASSAATRTTYRRRLPEPRRGGAAGVGQG